MNDGKVMGNIPVNYLILIRDDPLLKYFRHVFSCCYNILEKLTTAGPLMAPIPIIDPKFLIFHNDPSFGGDLEKWSKCKVTGLSGNFF